MFPLEWDFWSYYLFCADRGNIGADPRFVVSGFTFAVRANMKLRLDVFLCVQFFSAETKGCFGEKTPWHLRAKRFVHVRDSSFFANEFKN
jgi:hypothetical protein